MVILMLLIMLFTILLVGLIGIVSYKIIKNKTLPDNNYTPFDYITAQATVEFHEACARLLNRMTRIFLNTFIIFQATFLSLNSINGRFYYMYHISLL
ncbi:DUF3951 domain-containing protein [Bacillus pseudomycoides]|uniref:DUF3951 domain-containing protein n=1 Tax=Bacillus pseudomycoides TaxID=64104 RepID=UPI003D1B990E